MTLDTRIMFQTRWVTAARKERSCWLLYHHERLLSLINAAMSRYHCRAEISAEVMRLMKIHNRVVAVVFDSVSD